MQKIKYMKTEIEVLKSIGNAVVAKSSERNYPGVLIQGDTLRILLGDIEELKENNLAGNYEEVKDIVDALEKRLSDILICYEGTLKENNIDIPYMNLVGKIVS